MHRVQEPSTLRLFILRTAITTALLIIGVFSGYLLQDVLHVPKDSWVTVVFVIVWVLLVLGLRRRKLLLHILNLPVDRARKKDSD